MVAIPVSVDPRRPSSLRDQLDVDPIPVPKSTRMAASHRVEINPKVMMGKPVIRGTRITVELILRKLSEGATEAAQVLGKPVFDFVEMQARDLDRSKGGTRADFVDTKLKRLDGTHNTVSMASMPWS